VAMRRSVGQASTKPVHSDIGEVEDLGLQTRELQRAQNPFAAGVQLDFAISDIEPALGPRKVVLKHKLGRVPAGWIALDLTCPYVLTSIARSTWDTNTITLIADRGCSGKVLVY
jgi:hypothetical protein